MQTHIVPVGFDYDRLIAPLVRDKIDVDRVILLKGAVGSEANVEYSRHLTEKLETDFRNLLGADTERFVVEDVYDFDAAFKQGYDLINAELGDRDEPNEVWVNVSAMPRTVSFAFASAAHSIMVDLEADRDLIHTYYTAPEKYLETEMAEELRRLRDLLTEIERGGIDDDRIQQRLDAADDLLAEFDERGTTIGAKEIGGSHIVEFPVASFSRVKPFEELILFKLGDEGEFESVSELAKALAAELNEEYTDSFRSKVIYNVDRLGPSEKGYVEQEREGKSHRTRLSRIGELWVRAHSDDEPDVESLSD
ncbi:MAG: DUF6293 family protein [Halobacteriales archaeon]